MLNDDFQFYPTPPVLARRAWAMFSDQEPDRVLDPSAGNGDLLLPKQQEQISARNNRGRISTRFDAIEIDPARHPLLEKRFCKVVGHDFLQFTGVGLLGMRLKTTRFVLPGFGLESWQSQLGFNAGQCLQDIDRVFAMMDGKHQDSVEGLAKLFSSPQAMSDLRHGSREKSDYFEVRYYPKRGTIHFFPRSKDLMDCLNRFVGKRRQWIPRDKNEANKDWHAQHEKADAVDKALRAKVSARQLLLARGEGGIAEYVDPARAAMDAALNAVMDENGWHPDSALESDEAGQLLLLAE